MFLKNSTQNSFYIIPDLCNINSYFSKISFSG
jgi:hypothetical protein